MVQEEAVVKPKPSIYIETKYSDKVTFTAAGSTQIRRSKLYNLQAFAVHRSISRWNLTAAAKLILTSASGGAMSTETLQTFSEEGYRKIISELS